MPNILGFAGSLRNGPYNRTPLHAAADLVAKDARLDIFDLEEDITLLLTCLDFALPLPHRSAATDDVANIYTATGFVHRHHQAAHLTSI